MIKKFAVLLTAGIFFLTPPTDAQATGHFPDEQTVNQPFVEDEVEPLTEEEFRRIFGDGNDEPPVKPIEPQPVEPINPPPVIEQPPVDDGEGLEFLMYNQDGVMAFAIIADHEKYQLKPVLARGQIRGRATVSQMNAPDAIATINASYFAPSGTLYGNTRIDGITASTTDFIRSAIGIRSDGSTIFARQTYRGVLQFNGNEVVVSGVNGERGENAVIVYNFLYGVTTGTNNHGVEIIVDNGEVVNISRTGDSYIPPNGFVVSAHGTAAEQFNSVSVGDRITFDEDFINVERGADFNEAIHILGAGPTLVKHGEIYVTADAEQFPSDIRVGRAPRSAVGVTQYGDYIFAVVDGRQAHSKGCTLTEWARILLYTFGAVDAINLDGGGSTELIFKGSLVNKPSDGRERLVGDALTIVRR